MKMMKEYRYLGSAPHLAFTSILIGMVFWQQLVTSTEQNDITPLGLAATTLVFGVFVAYCYKFTVTTKSPEPLRLKKLPMSVLIINLGFLSVLFPIMVFVMMFSLVGQATQKAEYVMSVTYGLSILIGIKAILSAPRDKTKQ